MKTKIAIITCLILLLSSCTLRKPNATTPPKPIYKNVLDKWIHEHRRIGLFIKWDDSTYFSWNDAQKKQLYDLYVLVKESKPLGLVDPPVNVSTTADTSFGTQRMTTNDARRLYLSYVANSIDVEIKKKVPWSLMDLDNKGLSIILDGGQMFTLFSEGIYKIDRKTSGRVTPAPSDYTLNFMKDKIGSTKRETIENTIAWCGGMKHFLGRFTGGNIRDQWGYKGYPPVSIVIEGSGPNKRSITAGCHGTAGFLRAVLRSVNIPVEIRYTDPKCSHAHPCFVGENVCLSHGDDPYNSLFKRSGKPVSELLITEETFQKWFRTGDKEFKCSNVGRRAKELHEGI